MTQKNNFTHSFVTDPEKVASFFEALIEGFRKRELFISSDGREVALHPAEILDMTLATTHRNGRTKITVSVNWPETHRRSSNTLQLTPPELREA
jgi:amphi-Trp domain-containing protein